MRKRNIAVMMLSLALALSACGKPDYNVRKSGQEASARTFAAEETTAADAADEKAAAEDEADNAAGESISTEGTGKTESAAAVETAAAADKGAKAKAETADTAEAESGAEDAADSKDTAETAEAETPDNADAAGDAEKAAGAGQTGGELGSDNVYADMDGIIFGFMSGVGAWETTLKVEADGSFVGQFFDMNMGETGEGYDNGTLYECAFTGRFSEAVRVDDTSWEAKVEELHYETQKDGKDEYIDAEGVRHIMTVPYGLSRDCSIRIYSADKKTAELSEEFMSWMFWKIPEDAKELGKLAIYNETDKTVFYPDEYAPDPTGEETEAESGTDADQVQNITSVSSEIKAGEEGTAAYRAVRDAYDRQEMPEYGILPYVPFADEVISKPYPSVTIANLQGRWVNRYKEGGSEVEEILTVNGDRGRIETWIDGEQKGVWNGTGFVSLEDRSDRNVCPAFRINDQNGDNLCTIYIRWVKDNAFYDAVFLNEWKRESPENPAEQYLYDTVKLENLQGIWYSEQTDGGGFYQSILKIEGSEATLFETINNEPDKFWNGKGPARVVLERFRSDIYYPELLIELKETKGSQGTTAGIYITNVTEDSFYDPAFARWWIRVRPDLYDGFDYHGPEIESLDNGGAIVRGTYTYTLTPQGEMKDDHYEAWKVLVTGEDGLEQELELDIGPDSLYYPEAESIVSESDVNFDGITDVLLFNGCRGIHYTQSWQCWISDGKTFTKCEGFEEIPDPYTDGGDKLLHGTILDGADSYLYFTYRIENNKAVKVEETRHSIAE